VLARRIARAHGFQRTGKRIQDRVEQLAAEFATTQEDVNNFYWPAHATPGGHLKHCRSNGNKDFRPGAVSDQRSNDGWMSV
jgi:hypothetical protein